MRRTSPSLVTDSPIPHQNFKLSTSTLPPTLAHVCTSTFPDNSRVSHALAILHLRPRPLCRWSISAPSTTCSPPSRPFLSYRRSRDVLHTFRYPISSPHLDTQQAIHGGFGGYFHRTEPWPSRVARDAGCEGRGTRGATRWRDTFALWTLLRNQVQAVSPETVEAARERKDGETLNVTLFGCATMRCLALCLCDR